MRTQEEINRRREREQNIQVIMVTIAFMALFIIMILAKCGVIK